MGTLTTMGLEKVAVLLKRLPTEVVDKALRLLDQRQAGLILSQLKKLKDGDLDQRLAGVLDEAVQVIQNDTRSKPERPGPGKPLETGATSGKTMPAQEPAQPSKQGGVDIRVGDNVEPGASPAPVPSGPDEQADPLRALASLPSDLLATALNNENARTASLLMNSLDIEVASQIYKRLAPAKRREISLRFTDQTTVGAELVKRIAQGVLKKCRTLTVAPPTPAPAEGVREKRMAALLRELERAERMELLTALGESDAELTGRIKALLYEFEDILRMENASVQKLLSEVDVKTLSQALRGAPEDIEAKILANLSKRAQESLKEEISLTGKVPAASVRQARQTFLEAMQRLDQRGELVMIEGS